MLSFAFRTHIGGSYNTENQDAFLTAERRFCLADGHGKKGKQVAEAVCALLCASTDDAETSFTAAENAVKDVDGGSTASLLEIDADGTCRLAHVGDSEVRYFDTDDGEGIGLTADHSPVSLDEFRRIHALNLGTDFTFGGSPRYLPYRQVFVPGVDGTDWVMNPLDGFEYCNVRREWSAYVTTPLRDRLAMTRAIGDFHMKSHGVICTPSISTVAPAAGTRAIVMASDGLWDAMQYDEVRAIVRNPECMADAELAATRLLDATLETGSRLFGTRLDNVSLGVIYVKTA